MKSITTVSAIVAVCAAALCNFGIPQAMAAGGAATGDPAAASRAVNALGLDLMAGGTEPGDNALLSPFSIQTALAMTFAGASGGTRDEMAKVLHLAGEEAPLHASFAALRHALDETARRTAELSERMKKSGGGGDPVTLTVANRLFGQTGYDFRSPFLEMVKDTYGAPFQPMDFIRNSAGAAKEINGWVEEKTRQRIRDLIPSGALDRETRLVLVNAVYLKAPWQEVFPAGATKPAPFHPARGAAVDVPTMVRQGHFGYAKHEAFSAITVPYSGGDLQLLILLPDRQDGLAALEAKLTPEKLAACARSGSSELILHLPKFKLEPPLLKLGAVLQKLGMKSAFDRPRGSADFDRMAPRKPDDYLYISEIFHKTFLELDEKGTEAAAATAVAMMLATAVIMEPPKPIEVRVDHPFLFAIQHRPSGASLFMGRITRLH